MTDSPFRPFRSAGFDFQSARSDNVIQIDHAQSDNQTAEFPACAELLIYWQTLSGSRQMPARREFDPRGVETSLACTFVAEKVAPSVARLRVAGSLLNETLGMDVRGMPITSLFDPCARDALAEATKDLFEAPAMTVLELSARRSFNRKPIRARMLLLPMSDGFGEVNRLVGCLDICGGLGKTPRRFQINSIRRTELTGEKPITTIEETPFMPAMRAKTPVPQYEFAEDAVVFENEPQKKVASLRSGLRLVVSND